VRLGDLPLFIDQIGDAFRVAILRGFRGAVGEADAAIGVAEEGEGEVELFGEVLVLVRRVEADAEDLRVLRFVLRDEVPEPGTLTRSTRGVGLRVEPEDDLLPPQVAELHMVAVVVEDFEIGRWCAGLEHGLLLPSILSHRDREGCWFLVAGC
jgi:hypothetical protein